MKRPSIGRIVLYNDEWGGKQPRPAMVINVNENGSCDLSVFTAIGNVMGKVGVPQGSGPRTWYWPPRDDEG